MAILAGVLTMPVLALVLFRAWAAPEAAAHDSPQGAAVSATGDVAAPPLEIVSDQTHNEFMRRAEQAAADALERVQQEQSSARAAFERELRTQSGFSWPVLGGVTSPFGPRGSGFHHGVDIGCGLGAAIRASAAGQVVWAEPAAVYGNAVAIDHDNGYVTLYAHLSRIDVGVEQLVSRGSVIGLCGSTGHSTGPHLHFEIRKGGYVYDPTTLLR